MTQVQEPKATLDINECRSRLLDGLTASQQEAVQSSNRRVLIVAGAGSGKTEVMARRIAWWVAVEGVPKNSIVAFTFTERAAEEMKFRIRERIAWITPEGEDATLGGMYVGTIHGFCLAQLRSLDPDTYHNYDVLDESSRYALIQRGYHHVLGLTGFKDALNKGMYTAIDDFLYAYDLLNEYAELSVQLPEGLVPARLEEEQEWCKAAKLLTNIGVGSIPEAFAVSAARYYAYLRCRRFLDFSTSQAELVHLLTSNPDALTRLHDTITHVVVDEVQDLNPVQDRIVRAVVGDSGRLTAVGDHRQAIYGWRGGRVELMGRLFAELEADPNGAVVDLASNFRSTPRIIKVANSWARTIGAVNTMTSPDMLHGNKGRTDYDPSHVAALSFSNREDEADWIASAIRRLIPEDGTGAVTDKRDGERGLSYSDVTVLIRSSTDARTYMRALERAGIPAVVKAGPDLFSQPEILLFLGALSLLAGIDQFYGSDHNPKSLPNRIGDVLGCRAEPEPVLRAACRVLREAGLPMAPDVDNRLVLACKLLQAKMAGDKQIPASMIDRLHTPALRDLIRRGSTPRRVFPQALYHLLLSEAGVSDWDSGSGRGATAIFHLGQLSSLITGIETPGWTTPNDLKYQIIALYLWGTANGRAEEAPLMVAPDAVVISTIHGAKGLEFGAVFVADVASRRFPSAMARRLRDVPFEGDILNTIDPAQLADNANTDAERRLMYVALTRAERYLFVTSSKPSAFFRTVADDVGSEGGTAAAGTDAVPSQIRHATAEFRSDVRLATSFSDLRYYLECPHDFYLRKVVGFSPTIDQAFGYGRGVHNLMRAIHSDPKAWSELANDPQALNAKLKNLMDRGLFYMRYTTGDPLARMRNKALQIIGDYVHTYQGELSQLEFEPEREFETLIEEEQVLVSGAMDIVRLDEPPRVTLIDFKSGEPDSDLSMKLDEDEMRLQVSVYGLAAKHELEYEPDLGLVRYLGTNDPNERELIVDLDDDSLAAARAKVVDTARNIRDRQFHSGPTRLPRNPEHKVRCQECDFFQFCGIDIAKQTRGHT